MRGLNQSVHQRKQCERVKSDINVRKVCEFRLQKMSEKFVQPAIPRFDGHYDFWAMTMENFLLSKELWSLVEEGIPKLGTAPTEAHTKNVSEASLNI